MLLCAMANDSRVKDFFFMTSIGRNNNISLTMKCLFCFFFSSYNEWVLFSPLRWVKIT